ncbi:hypothetical protein FRC17_004788 [Serendipita sp. 399]|nr:hypothetical protein FRC17_004788 [Serendipita sp. 399]
MDTLLAFAGLYSAIVTAFIIQNQQLLGSIGQDRTNDVLVLIALQLNRTAVIPSSQPSPTGSTIADAIFFASLFITLIAAVSAMLVKQWLHSVESLVGCSPRDIARSKVRQQRGIERYKIRTLMAIILTLFHFGVAVFFVGLLVWAYEGLNRKTFYTIAAIVTVGFLTYAGLIITLCVDQTTPSKSPFSTMLRWSINFSKLARTRLRDAYRSLVQTQVVNRPMPLTNRQGSVRKKLITYEPQDDCELEDLPSGPLEIEILQEMVESSLSIDDTCAALEDVRCMMLRDTFDPRHTFSTGKEPIQPASFRQVLLQRCTYIAALSVTSRGQAGSLIPHSINKVRSVCAFLETHLQTDFEPRGDYDILNQQSMRDFADALLDYGADPDTELGDISLVISVRALLRHKVFGYEDSVGCPDCFTFDTLLVDQFFRRALGELSTTALYDLQRTRIIHRFIRVILVTLTDCLLYHNSVDRMQRTRLQESIRNSMGAIGAFTDELEALMTYIETAKANVSEESEEMKWLDAILTPWTKKNT